LRLRKLIIQSLLMQRNAIGRQGVCSFLKFKNAWNKHRHLILS